VTAELTTFANLPSPKVRKQALADRRGQPGRAPALATLRSPGSVPSAPRLADTLSVASTRPRDSQLARCETRPIRERSPAFELARVREAAHSWPLLSGSSSVRPATWRRRDFPCFVLREAAFSSHLTFACRARRASWRLGAGERIRGNAGAASANEPTHAAGRTREPAWPNRHGHADERSRRKHSCATPPRLPPSPPQMTGACLPLISLVSPERTERLLLGDTRRQPLPDEAESRTSGF
jgi:hypothetical protein